MQYNDMATIFLADGAPCFWHELYVITLCVKLQQLRRLSPLHFLWQDGTTVLFHLNRNDDRGRKEDHQNGAGKEHQMCQVASNGLERQLAKRNEEEEIHRYFTYTEAMRLSQ